MYIPKLQKKSLSTKCLALSVLILCSGQLHAFDYALYGVDNCFLQHQPKFDSYVTGRAALLRCPLPISTVSSEKKIRVRLYTLPHQLATECHIAGSTQLAPTYYRFSRFNQVKQIKRKNEGLIYEANLGGEGFFVSPSEGETWKLNYEIQCSVPAQPFLHSYSVIQTLSHGAWVMN